MRINRAANAYRRMATAGMAKTGSAGNAVATALGHVGGRRTIRSDTQALRVGRRRMAVGGAALGGMTAWQVGMSPTRYRKRYGNQTSGINGMMPRSTGGYA